MNGCIWGCIWMYMDAYGCIWMCVDANGCLLFCWFWESFPSRMDGLLGNYRKPVFSATHSLLWNVNRLNQCGQNIIWYSEYIYNQYIYIYLYVCVCIYMHIHIPFHHWFWSVIYLMIQGYHRGRDSSTGGFLWKEMMVIYLGVFENRALIPKWPSKNGER